MPKVYGTLEGGREVLLTFDDGPHPILTPKLLDLLKEHDVKGVFCVLGERVAAWGGKAIAQLAFGRRILSLSWATDKAHGEELHGTYDYANMRKKVSHGCVRHYNEDIITIFDSVDVGDLVAIVDRVDDRRLKPPGGQD